MKQTAAIIIAACTLAGCSNSSAPPAPIPAGKLQWPADMSPVEAASLSPEQAKAILVARTALEARRGEPIHAQYRVTAEQDGWVIFVDFLAPAGYEKSTGSFYNVYLDREFSVQRIVGGV